MNPFLTAEFWLGVVVGCVVTGVFWFSLRIADKARHPDDDDDQGWGG